jgi:RNA polymerase sigma-70 factor (ECF subfamily)
MNDPDEIRREELYRAIADQHGGMIARLASAHERNPAARQDLEQDIHMHLWRSLTLFQGQCSLSTWTYRVAHNVCARHVEKAVRRKPSEVVDIADIEPADPRADPEESTGEALTLERLHAMIRQLRPADRQVMLLYLEDIDARGIAEITGLTAGAVATRIHRIKALLAEGFAPEVTA